MLGWNKDLRRVSTGLFFATLLGLAPQSALGDDAVRPGRTRYLIAQEEQPRGASVKAAPLVLRAELRKDAHAPEQGSVAWLSVVGERLKPGAAAPAGGIRLWGKRPGAYSLPGIEGQAAWAVLGVGAVNGQGRLATRASISRALPPELTLGTGGEGEEARSFVLLGPSELLPTRVTLVSMDGQGNFLDSSRGLPLVAAQCPAAWARTEGNSCVRTPFVRIAADPVERNHPAVEHRAILGEVGGSIRLRIDEQASFALPVAAPVELGERSSRTRARVRAQIVRTFAGGPPAVGTGDEDAIRIVREEIASASRMWGQCGVHLGSPDKIDVRVVDPPQLALLTVGCGRGLPASGGLVKFTAGDRRVFVRTRAQESVRSVALRVAAQLRGASTDVSLYRNARASRAAQESYDLLITDRRGKPVPLSIPSSGASTDRTLTVCEAQLNLADGLEHFTDENAAAGTEEERYLLRALSDDDPATIELIVVPVFSGLGRIGESFISTAGGSIDSALILDRTGIRAGSRSLTLAHELGHILLDLPGHPDDFGVDTPSSLMDSDAADATIFGPRHLTLDDCKRALTQSGAGAPIPLLQEWPLEEKPTSK